MGAGVEGAEVKVPTFVLSDEVLVGVERESEEWKTLSRRVREACEGYGCFLVEYDNVTSDEIQEALFKAMKSLFDLPTETKKKYKKERHYDGGYMGSNPYLPHYQAFAIYRQTHDEIETLSSLMWPQGNPQFCEVVNSMNSKLQQLLFIILELVFDSLGIPKYSALVKDDIVVTIRAAKYESPQNGSDNASLGLVPHVDKSVFTFLCQNAVQGLEFLSPDANWHPMPIPKGTLLVQLGDMFEVWSNGRFRGVEHRVMLNGGNESERYSYACFLLPKEDVELVVPPELVDEEHPSLYRPFKYGDYLKDAGAYSQGIGTLRAYAGI